MCDFTFWFIVSPKKCFHQTDVDTDDQKGISEQLQSTPLECCALFQVVVS